MDTSSWVLAWILPLRMLARMFPLGVLVWILPSGVLAGMRPLGNPSWMLPPGVLAWMLPLWVTGTGVCATRISHHLRIPELSLSSHLSS